MFRQIMGLWDSVKEGDVRAGNASGGLSPRHDCLDGHV